MVLLYGWMLQTSKSWEIQQDHQFPCTALKPAQHVTEHLDDVDVGGEAAALGGERAVLLQAARDVSRLPQRVLQPIQALLARGPRRLRRRLPPDQLLLQVARLGPARFS